MTKDTTIKIYNHSSENMTELLNGSVDFVLTSPPYNISTQYGEYNDTLNIESYIEVISSIIGEYYRVTKNDGLIAINIPEFVRVNNEIYFYPKLYEDIFKQHNLYRKSIHFWVKTNNEGFIDPSNRWDSHYKAVTKNIHSVTEWIMVFGKTPHTQKDNSQDGIIYSQRNSDKSQHPALWPLSLPSDLIKLYTHRYQVVLDPFMGIGTTGEACLKLSRTFIGYEISHKYFKIAKRNLLY